MVGMDEGEWLCSPWVRVQILYPHWVFAQDGEGWKMSCVETGVTSTRASAHACGPTQVQRVALGNERGWRTNTSPRQYRWGKSRCLVILVTPRWEGDQPKLSKPPQPFMLPLSSRTGTLKAHKTSPCFKNKAHQQLKRYRSEGVWSGFQSEPGKVRHCSVESPESKMGASSTPQECLSDARSAGA